MLKIGLDCDDTINYWWDLYVKRFGQPKNNRIVTKHVQNILRYDKDFWLSLPVKNAPDFEPTLICTKRVNNKAWTKKWLKDNLGITAPIYQMYYQKGNKATMIKGRVDVFVDDSVENMVQMNLSGVPCLLMDSPANQDWGYAGRVFSLNYDEIEIAYNEFIDTIFPNFKDYVSTLL